MKLQRAILLATSAPIAIIHDSAGNIMISVGSPDMNTNDVNGRHTMNKKIIPTMKLIQLLGKFTYTNR